MILCETLRSNGQAGSVFLSDGVTVRSNSAVQGGGFFDDGIVPLVGVYQP